VKAGKVYKTISGQKEIGNNWSDCVEISYNTTGECDNKGKNITPSWLIILSKSFAKVFNKWEEFVFTKSLKDFGSTNKTGQS
jgi:hypothetical protein